MNVDAAVARQLQDFVRQQQTVRGHNDHIRACAVSAETASGP